MTHLLSRPPTLVARNLLGSPLDLIEAGDVLALQVQAGNVVQDRAHLGQLVGVARNEVERCGALLAGCGGRHGGACAVCEGLGMVRTKSKES